jgi:Flp pilus assembly protein protease CpaA
VIQNVAEGVLVVGLLIACWTDVKSGKISNRLNGRLILAGIVLLSLAGEPLAPWMGIGLALLIHFPLWVIQVEKGGDAKLMMAVGALSGWRMMLETTLWCAVLYLPVGLLALGMMGRLKNVLPAVAYGLRKSTGWLPEFLQPYAAGARAMAPGEISTEAPPEVTLLKTAPVIAVAWALARGTETIGVLIN